VIAVDHDLPFETARQLKTFEKHVSWIEVSFARIAIPVASVLVAVARVFLFAIEAGTAPQFDPGHVYVARFVAL
jgi:hypothetical protein